MIEQNILENYRNMVRLSQADMAERLGITLHMYKNLESVNTKHGNAMNKVLDMIVGNNEAIFQKTIAQYVRKEIIAYRDKNPGATWREVWENVPSNYKSHTIMANKFNLYYRNRRPV